MNDQELNHLLAPLRRAQCSKQQFEKWQRAVRNESQWQHSLLTRLSRWHIPQVAAGLVLGFLIGTHFDNPKSPPISEPSTSATVEYIYANTH